MIGVTKSTHTRIRHAQGNYSFRDFPYTCRSWWRNCFSTLNSQSRSRYVIIFTGSSRQTAINYQPWITINADLSLILFKYQIFTKYSLIKSLVCMKCIGRRHGGKFFNPLCSPHRFIYWQKTRYDEARANPTCCSLLTSSPRMILLRSQLK